MEILIADGQTNRGKAAPADRVPARHPMRAISLTLLIMAYASTLPYNALWIETMTRGTHATPILIYVEIALGAFGLLLLAGYSAAVAGSQPWNSSRVFWAASTLFNGLIATMGILSLENLDAAAALLTNAMSYTPELHPSRFLPGYILTTIGSLSGFLIIFWMPVAAVLSFLQLLQVLLQNRGSSAGAR